MHNISVWECIFFLETQMCRKLREKEFQKKLKFSASVIKAR